MRLLCSWWKIPREIKLINAWKKPSGQPPKGCSCLPRGREAVLGRFTFSWLKFRSDVMGVWLPEPREDGEMLFLALWGSQECFWLCGDKVEIMARCGRKRIKDAKLPKLLLKCHFVWTVDFCFLDLKRKQQTTFIWVSLFKWVFVEGILFVCVHLVHGYQGDRFSRNPSEELSSY